MKRYFASEPPCGGQCFPACCPCITSVGALADLPDHATLEDVIAQLNALLASLRAVGLLDT